ncbi:MAG: TonB-dependent receptor [Myxococcales bacterium]|nr:TonB-dependent receptor [Myxococcales bacterium]
MNSLALATALAALTPGEASPRGALDSRVAARSLRGQVARAGDRSPIAGATVLVIPERDDHPLGPADAATADPDPKSLARVETDDAGRFRVEAELPGTRARVVILAAGYRRLDYVVARDRERPGEKVTRFFLRPDGEDPYRTVVRDQSAPEEDGGFARRSLRKEEIDTVPGAWGDPLLALQNMPGFFRAPAGLGVAIIRGGSPSASATFVGEHPVPRAFHMLPLTSVIPAPFVERIDYEPGNFGARYGDATVGMIRVHPRAGDTEGYHGHAELSLVSVGASVEGPAGPGSFLVAARRGYADLLIGVANRFGGQFSRPAYYDYQALYDMPLKSGGSLGVHVLGAGDAVRADGEGEDLLARRVFRSDFHRADLVYRRALGPYEVLLSPAFRFDVNADERNTPYIEDDGTFSITGEQDKRQDFNALLRAELRRRWTRALTTTLGADAQLDPYRYAHGSERDGDAPIERGVIGALGLYAQATLDLGPLRVVPATRFSGFLVGSRGGVSADPRLTLRARVGERWSLTAAIGQYSRSRYDADASTLDVIPGGYYGGGQGQPSIVSQIAVPPAYRQLVSPTILFAPLEESFYVQRALHTSAGVAVTPAPGWSIELVGFHRVILGHHALAEDARDIERWWSRAYGAELMLRRSLTRKLYGWLSYTLMRSDQLAQRQLDGAVTVYPNYFDQRHNLNLVLSYQLPRGWRVGGRLRLSSGIPYTPIVGSHELAGVNIPIFGPPSSARYPWFHQLDLRVDKRWLLKRASVTLYLDIQNVYGGQPVELYSYSADFKQRQGMPVLPILPVLGLRVDY